MTTDGNSLIMSDGTSNLTYLDPVSFKTNRIVGVTDNNGPVGNINELEWVNGTILANIYMTPYIIRIDPNTGKVLGKADFSKLVDEVKSKEPDVGLYERHCLRFRKKQNIYNRKALALYL